MTNRSFKSLFCERTGCLPDRFETVIFGRCLHRHAIPFAGLLDHFSARFFEEDRRAVEQFGIASSLDQVRAIVRDLAYMNRTNQHWLRTGLKFRLSGRKLYALAERLTENSDPPVPQRISSAGS